jgi:hypothetical protein
MILDIGVTYFCRLVLRRTWTQAMDPRPAQTSPWETTTTRSPDKTGFFSPQLYWNTRRLALVAN